MFCLGVSCPLRAAQQCFSLAQADDQQEYGKDRSKGVEAMRLAQELSSSFLIPPLDDTSARAQARERAWV